MSDKRKNKLNQNLPADLDDLFNRGFRYALSLTHNETEAEDLLQESCKKILKSGSPWHRGYLFATIRNQFIDDHRKKRTVTMEPLSEFEGKEAKYASLSFDDPFEDSNFENILALLRPEEREAIYLTTVEGYTAQEISELIDVPRGTVLSLLHRGRIKLQKILNKEMLEVFNE